MGTPSSYTTISIHWYQNEQKFAYSNRLSDVIASVNDINYGFIVEWKSDISNRNYVRNGVDFPQSIQH